MEYNYGLAVAELDSLADAELIEWNDDYYIQRAILDYIEMYQDEIDRRKA